MYGGGREIWGFKFGQYGVSALVVGQNQTPLGWELYEKGKRDVIVKIFTQGDQYIAKGPLVRNIEDEGDAQHTLILVDRKSDLLQDGTTLTRTTFDSKKGYRICINENQGYEWADMF